MNGFNFTERVRQVLAQARDEAFALDHESVGTEHVLLALVANPDGVAGAVIGEIGADPEAIRSLVLQAVQRGTRPPAAGSDLPYTSRGKKVLELAMAEASELNHRYVGTEHLLLGLLREEKGIGAQVLVNQGVTLQRARTEMLRILGQHVAPGTADTASSVRRRPAPQPADPAHESTAWARLSHAIDACQRLGTTPSLTLEEDGTLSVPLGPDLVVSVAFPPEVGLRRRSAPPNATPASAEERA